MNRITRHLSKLVTPATILSVAILILFTGCSVKKPQSPSWLTVWDIPITNKTFAISELLEKIDDAEILTDSLGNPFFQFSQSVDTIAVETDLTFDGATVDIYDSVGVLEIDPPSTATASTNIDSVLTVTFGVVPQMSFDYDQNLSAIDNFSWVEIESGILDLTFFNGLEIDLDTFVVSVIDQADLHVVGVATYANGLNYTEEETQSIDLSGQTISNNLMMSFHGHTPGGVLVTSGPHTLDATLSFPSVIRITAGRAETPEISKYKREVTEIDTDSTRIISSSIASGTLQIEISNYTQLTFSVDLISPNFSKDGIDPQVSRQVASMGVTQATVDLAGYDFVPTDSASSQYVAVEFNGLVPASAPSQNTFSAADSIKIRADLSSVTFEYITGQIKPIGIDIDPIQQDLDLPEGLDQARLTRAELSLDLYNNSTIPADIDLTIAGNGRIVDLAGRIEGKSSQGSPPELTRLTLGPEELSDFFDPPPTQITISGGAIMNPDYEVLTIAADDDSYIYGDIEISSPFAFAITDIITVDMDISEVEIDEDSRPDNFQETFRYGAIDVEFESHLPLGASLTLYIGTASDSTLYVDPNSIVMGPYTLQPGSVDTDGHVIESAISQISDSLDSNDLTIFDNDTIYVGQKIGLLPTDTTGVHILGNDYIRIRSDARIQVLMGPNIWEDN